MERDWPAIWSSAITAFLIVAGGALGVVFVGGKPSSYQIAAAAVLGAVSAAKDYRSTMKLPPVKTNGGDTQPPIKT